MTISSAANRKTFTGVGTTGPFSFPYTITELTDLVVLRVVTATGVSTTLALNSGYTASGSVDSVGRYAAGVDITTATAVAVGETLIVYSDPPITQEIDFVENDPLPAEQIELGFDKRTVISRRLNELIGRSIRISDSSPESISTILPQSSGGQAIGWNADGTALINIDLSTGTALVDLSADNGSSLIGYLPAGSGVTARTVQEKLRRYMDVMDRGAVNDKTTDNTATILAAAIAAAADGIELLEIPYGVKYNVQTLLSDPTFPTNIRLFDKSGVNGYQGSGESNFSMGIVSGDRAEDDTHWLIESGHHAVLQTNNPGTAGTTSADARLASWLWSVGHHQLNLATDKVGGYRTGGIAQWRLTPGGEWDFNMRSLAPGPSIEGDYEFWSDDETIAGAGVHRATANSHYVSTGAIASGSGEPVHTSGTVGNWQWLDSVDRGLWGVDEYGRWLIGNGAYNEGTLTVRVGLTDPSGSFVFNGVARGVSKAALVRLTGTNSSGTEVPAPYIRSEAIGSTPSTYVMKSDSSTALVTFTDAEGITIHCQAGNFVEHSSTATTPDLSGRYVVYFTAASPVSITDITIAEGALLECHFTNSNVTFVHSSSLMLTGSTNVNPTNGSVITFRRYPDSVSEKVVEVSRSIK